MDGSQPLQNPKHERFALLVAAGETSAAEAYKQAVSAKCSPATAETSGPKLARDTQVAIRISWLRSKAAETAKEKAEGTVLTILEKRQFIARVIRAAPSAATMKNPDCELVMTKMGPRALFPSKAALIKLDNDLAGDGSEAKGHSAIAELVSRIRR